MQLARWGEAHILGDSPGRREPTEQTRPPANRLDRLTRVAAEHRHRQRDKPLGRRDLVRDEPRRHEEAPGKAGPLAPPPGVIPQLRRAGRAPQSRPGSSSNTISRVPRRRSPGRAASGTHRPTACTRHAEPMQQITGGAWSTEVKEPAPHERRRPPRPGEHIPAQPGRRRVAAIPAGRPSRECPSCGPPPLKPIPDRPDAQLAEVVEKIWQASGIAGRPAHLRDTATPRHPKHRARLTEPVPPRSPGQPPRGRDTAMVAQLGPLAVTWGLPTWFDPEPGREAHTDDRNEADCPACRAPRT